MKKRILKSALFGLVCDLIVAVLEFFFYVCPSYAGAIPSNDPSAVMLFGFFLLYPFNFVLTGAVYFCTHKEDDQKKK